MSFEPIRNLLGNAVERSGAPAALSASQVIALWPATIKKVMPEKAWDKSVAKKLAGGQLTIHVKGATWAQEYKLHFPQLIREINRQARRNVVRTVYFRVR